MAVPAYIRRLNFAAGSPIELHEDQICVVVGPNNSGKTTLLREIASRTSNGHSAPPGMFIRSIELETKITGDDAIKWFESTFPKSFNGSYVSGQGQITTTEQIRATWSRLSSGFQQLAPFLTHFADISNRLNIANPAPNIDFTTQPLSHPLHVAYEDDKIEQQLSDEFYSAFGQHLILNRGAGGSIPLHCGTPPPLREGEDRVSGSYLKRLKTVPLLNSQGAGMRSFVGAILHATTRPCPMVFIDEPDVYLHPPQSRILGRILAGSGNQERQLFLATHSSHLLRGLLERGSNRLRILRIERDKSDWSISELAPEEIEKLWSDPILRFSDLLDGLFYDRVVVCESDSDCRFYSAVSDAISTDEMTAHQPDTMFTHCGGKHRIPTVLRALKSIHVPSIAVTDFDVFREEKTLKGIVEALGADWSSLEKDWHILNTQINAKSPPPKTKEVADSIREILNAVPNEQFPSQIRKRIQAALRDTTVWSEIKNQGRNAVPPGDATQACDRLLASLMEIGLFIVPVGELESFARSIGGHGPKWLTTAIERDLQFDAEFEDARKFVGKLREWRPI